MANLKAIELVDGIATPCNLDGRQYNATGTGVVDIYGISIGSTTYEKLFTLTVSGTAVSQRSSDLHPVIKGVITSGAPKFNVQGFERF